MPDESPIAKCADEGDSLPPLPPLVGSGPLLPSPVTGGETQTQRHCNEFITTLPNLDLVPVPRDAVRAAVRVRATDRIGFPDAIHVATAVLWGCEVFLTNDRELLHVPAVRVCRLSDWSPPCV